MDHPTTRKEAKDTGAKYYFTGKPCKHGHIALRQTKGSCVTCIEVTEPAYSARRKLRPKTEAAKEAGRRYYEKNKEAVIARASARPLEDKQRWKSAHKSKNKDYYNTLTSLRKRRHKDATPPWLTIEQKHDIRNLYQTAMDMTRITGERYVVDHIVPLLSNEVCGLHVPWNLRVITQTENLLKSNKLVEV